MVHHGSEAAADLCSSAPHHVTQRAAKPLPVNGIAALDTCRPLDVHHSTGRGEVVHQLRQLFLIAQVVRGCGCHLFPELVFSQKRALVLRQKGLALESQRLLTLVVALRNKFGQLDFF